MKLKEAFLTRISWTIDNDNIIECLNSIIQTSLKMIPFDNLGVFERPNEPLSIDSVYDKIIKQHQGGLCYETNFLLNCFLLELQLDAILVLGTVYHENEQAYGTLPNTHVFNLVNINENIFIADIGMGLKSPKVLVPIDGSVVQYNEIMYKVISGEYYVLKAFVNNEWHIRYRFSLDCSKVNLKQLNEVKQTIVHNEKSPFNKEELIAKVIDEGSITLTKQNYTVKKNNEKTIIKLKKGEYQRFKKQLFDLS